MSAPCVCCGCRFPRGRPCVRPLSALSMAFGMSVAAAAASDSGRCSPNTSASEHPSAPASKLHPAQPAAALPVQRLRREGSGSVVLRTTAQLAGPHFKGLVQPAGGHRGGGCRQSLRGSMRRPEGLEAHNEGYAEGARCVDRSGTEKSLEPKWRQSRCEKNVALRCGAHELWTYRQCLEALCLRGILWLIAAHLR